MGVGAGRWDTGKDCAASNVGEGVFLRGGGRGCRAKAGVLEEGKKGADAGAPAAAVALGERGVGVKSAGLGSCGEARAALQEAQWSGVGTLQTLQGGLPLLPLSLSLLPGLFSRPPSVKHASRASAEG